jgi:hypothetical protein
VKAKETKKGIDLSFTDSIDRPKDDNPYPEQYELKIDLPTPGIQLDISIENRKKRNNLEVLVYQAEQKRKSKEELNSHFQVQ